MSVLGSLASTIGQINPFRYRGYYYDSETGLYYLQSRYYDPDTGRMLNSDTVLGEIGSILMSSYSYCNNNPTNRVDYNGYWSKSISKSGNSSILRGSQLSWRAYASLLWTWTGAK